MHLSSRSVRRRVATVAAVALALAGLTACSSSPATSSGTGAKEFTYWSMWTKDEPVAKVLAQAIASFEKDEGVTVHVQWQGRDVLTKVKAAMNTSQVPDLIDQSFFRTKATLGNSHEVLDLTSVYGMKVPGESDRTVRDAVPANYDALNTADKLILVPYYVSAFTVWYSGKANPDLVSNPPKTWDEYTGLFPAVKAKGMAPIGLDGDDLDDLSTFVYSALERALGPGKLHDLIADHSGNGWDDPKVKAALSAIAQLASDKDYIPGYDSSKYPAMEKKWAQGKAAFLYMGSWVPYYDGPDAAPDFDLHTFNLPQLVGTDHSVPVTTYGFAVPSKAQNVPAAEKFITYLMGRKWLTQLSSDASILTPDPSIQVPPILKDLQGILKDNNLYLGNDGITADFPNLTKQFAPLNQALITGKSGVDKYLSGVKAAQAQYWKLNG